MKKNYALIFLLILTTGLSAQNLIYFNDFENGIGDSAKIVGNGQIVMEDETHGYVFHNAAGGQAIRSNYLLLPDTIFKHVQDLAATELAISFWVNVGTATDYYWTPMFSAYGAAPASTGNTWPMMILQSRLVGQVNCAGWCDMVDANNVAAANYLSTSWLDDSLWHHYTATFTATAVKIYVDGVVQNEWALDNTTDGQIVSGLFSSGSDLKYICLGGNQAWDWADVDPAYKYDDVAIYTSALTTEQIQNIITQKTNTTGIQVPKFDPEADLIRTEYYSIGGAEMGSNYQLLKRGIYIKKAVYSNGYVSTTKISKVSF